MKKVLFMVPHEDDEIFVGGPLLVNLTNSKDYETFVFIATNGDYYPFENKIRVQESLMVLKEIGVAESNIFFGGYGDCWQGKHIYNSADDEIKISQGGYNQTYLDNDVLQEWHYLREGKHILYTRRAYLEDIKSLILHISADVIIGVDMDVHRDHRCLSLLLDEAIKDIIGLKNGYTPILLKKYAYQGVLFGERDFFSLPHKRTQNYGNKTSNPFLEWRSRIAYEVPSNCNTKFLKDNFLYKLIKMYKSQNMWTYSDRFINTDIVYWMRNVNNLGLLAKFEVSSGNKTYLNDFKLVDTPDVVQPECDYVSKCWRPEKEDENRKIKISFDNEYLIRHIIFYFNTPGGISIDNVKLSFFDKNGRIEQEKTISYDDKNDFSVMTVHVDKILCAFIEIRFMDVMGNLGIGEIEFLDNYLDIPFREFLYKEDNNDCSLGDRLLIKKEQLEFKMQCYKYRKKSNQYEIRRSRYDRGSERE